jgi:phage terminase large subunit-like protein
LHGNEWVSSESVFILPEQWDACVDPERTSLLSGATLSLGVDIGVKSDNAAVVGVTWQDQKVILATHKAWRPTRTQPVNLQDVEDYILELRRRHRIVRLYADPYQAMQMLQNLQRKMGESIVQEFPQTVANTTIMGETLFDLIKNRNLIAYADAQIREHVTNATGIETARGYRLAKDKASKKIDLAVALAMACCAALQAGKPMVSPGAVPVGVGNQTIANEMRRLGISSTWDQPGPFKELPDDENLDDDQPGLRRGRHGLFGVYEYDERTAPPRRKIPIPS